MPVKVAVVPINQDYSAALNRAIDLIGGIADLNTPTRPVTIKIGLFDPRQQHHSCLETVAAINAAFSQAPQIHLAESDSYCGKALDRLERFRPLFDSRVTPHSLSDDPQAQVRTIAGQEIPLSPVLFKPNVIISTHVLRNFTRGSILKNLFGCTPEVKKGKYHKREVFNALLCDLFEASGGIDLAVLDGTYLHNGASDKRVRTDILVVGRDAVAVETVGAVIAGLKPEKHEVIQAFVKRGLGIGDMSQIEIVGMTRADLEGFKAARQALKKQLNEAPRGLGVSDTIDCLTSEGWMDAFRSAVEVTDELQKRGVENATKTLVDATMKRRLGKTLEREKVEGGWGYRRKQS